MKFALLYWDRLSDWAGCSKSVDVPVDNVVPLLTLWYSQSFAKEQQELDPLWFVWTRGCYELDYLTYLPWR